MILAVFERLKNQAFFKKREFNTLFLKGFLKQGRLKSGYYGMKGLGLAIRMC